MTQEMNGDSNLAAVLNLWVVALWGSYDLSSGRMSSGMHIIMNDESKITVMK